MLADHPAVQIRHSHAGASATIAVAGELDLFSSADLRRALTNLDSKDGPDTLVLDLRDVSFCDASGVATILGARRRWQRRGDTIELHASDAVAAVLALCEVDL